MTETGQSWRLDGEDITLVFVAVGLENIDLAYFGPRLPDDEDLDALVRSGQQGKHENQPDEPPLSGLLTQRRYGYAGRPAFQLWSNGREVDPDFRLANIDTDGTYMQATWVEHETQLQVDMRWEVTGERIIEVAMELVADGQSEVAVKSANTLSLPLPRRFTNVTTFPGRWAREMQATTTEIGSQALEMRSANGKPGFDPGNWLIFSGDETAQRIGIHVSSNGDHAAHIERDQDGRVALALGASDPDKVIIILGDDQDHLTQLFHSYVRTRVLPNRRSWAPRKVHLNSWEALGFDLDEAKLMALADAAADLGAERLVLDDGWFKGRRGDTAGLGDWQVDEHIFPNGLKPLIDHVHDLGMDFGLWVEPEMVSPDSDLYRAHPDWCLHHKGAERPTERNQLVLDLSREEVFTHIHDALCALLDHHDIAYIKWDHNRRLFPDNGEQQYAIDHLLRSIRQRYPSLEIESCSSGGGRVSFSILEHCQRIWPSDNNDPIERLRIMDSWTRFLPLEILGNHVGPSPNPVTGRRTDMDFRAKTALFGHMGVEANPADMSAAERDILRAHIALYKEWREVLHEGQFRRLQHSDEGIYGQMVVGDGRALAIAAQTRFAENFNAAPILLPGLDPGAQYKVMLPEPWPRKASTYLSDPEIWRQGITLSGRALADRGIALPLTHPETAWLIAIEKVTG